MTDEEFERLKEAEKEHLRAKKKLLSRLNALKRRNRVQSVVENMRQGAERLLDETERLVEALRGHVVKDEARVEMSLDDDIQEADEKDREARADDLIRQYKSSQTPSSRTQSSNADSEDDTSEPGPEKTIGRMRPQDSQESSS